MSTIVRSWLERAVFELSDGEQLFLESADAQSAGRLKRQFVKEYSAMQSRLGIELPTLQFTALRKDSRFWLCITKSKVDLSVGYKKSAEGTVKRLTISAQPSIPEKGSE